MVLSFAATPARADVSSWLMLGGGVAGNHSSRPEFGDFKLMSSMRLETGMGTDPSRPFVIGGLVRLDTMFSHGSDMSALVRIADNGFVNGDWGLGFDIGAVARYWGEPNAFGASGTLLGGGPWGLELQVGGLWATHETKTVSVILGIDLARLTVYRKSGSSWWKNTFPAVRNSDDEHSEPGR